MIKTLTNLESRMELGKKRFLIAGSKHLHEIQYNLNNQPYIEKLHSFLNSRKAVILVPKFA